MCVRNQPVVSYPESLAPSLSDLTVEETFLAWSLLCGIMARRKVFNAVDSVLKTLSGHLIHPLDISFLQSVLVQLDGVHHQGQDTRLYGIQPRLEVWLQLWALW